MRAAFGLVGLLVGVAVLIAWWGIKGGVGDYTQTTLKTGKQVQEELKPLTGAGMRDFRESISIEASTAGGKTVALLVTDIKPGGLAEAFYGLKTGDAIVQIGDLRVKDQMTSGEEGFDYLAEAYGRKQAIVVSRDDKEIVLPQAVQPTAGPPRDDRGSLQRQLDNITNAGQRPPGGN